MSSHQDKAPSVSSPPKAFRRDTINACPTLHREVLEELAREGKITILEEVANHG